MNIHSLLIMRHEKFVVAIMSQKRNLYVIISQGIISNRLKSFSKCQYILSVKITIWWVWLNASCILHQILVFNNKLYLAYWYDVWKCIGIRYYIYISMQKFFFADLLKIRNIVIFTISFIFQDTIEFCAI